MVGQGDRGSQLGVAAHSLHVPAQCQVNQCNLELSRPGGLLEGFDEHDAVRSPLWPTSEKLFHQGHAMSAIGIKTFSSGNKAGL